MKKYKIAAWLMIIHGGFLELGGVLCIVPALIVGADNFNIGQYFAFRLPYFQDNLYMMMVMGAIYGILRLFGAIGLLKNRLWGLALSVINCIITITLMMFPTARRHYGWNSCRQRSDFNIDAIFWQ